jgi:hypothetical protein
VLDELGRAASPPKIAAWSWLLIAHGKITPISPCMAASIRA